MRFPDTGNSYESGVCVCLQRPGKVRNPPEVRSSGGSGGGSGDGEPGTSPPRPQLPGDAAEPPEKVCKLPAGAARTPGHLGDGRAGARGASSLPGAKPAAATSYAELPTAGGGRARRGRGHRPWRALGFHSRRGRLERGEALLAFAPPAASCLCPVLAGIITSSPPLPQMTAPAFAAAARWQFSGPGGRVFLSSRFSTESLKTFQDVLRGARRTKEPRRCFLPAAASRFSFAIDLFRGGSGEVSW